MTHIVARDCVTTSRMGEGSKPHVSEREKFLLFTLGGQRCVLRGNVVTEVVRAVEITPLPNAPAVVEGIIDVRGEIQRADCPVNDHTGRNRFEFIVLYK